MAASVLKKKVGGRWSTRQVKQSRHKAEFNLIYYNIPDGYFQSSLGAFHPCMFKCNTYIDTYIR